MSSLALRKSCLFVGLATLVAGTAKADPAYTFTLVDAFNTEYALRECYLYDINDQNVACGTSTIRIGSTTTYTGFYWTPPNSKTAIPLTWPRGISNPGLIAGVAAIYDISSGQVTSMPLLPGTYYPLVLLGINDAGVAVGYVQTCNCSNSQGVLQVPYVWDGAGGASLPVPNAKGAARINNDGLIVGWTDGNSMPDGYLHDPNTGQSTIASTLFVGPNVQTTMVDVNDEGVVVGWRKNENGTIAWGYTWSETAGVTLLPLPSPEYQPYVRPSSVNRHGVIVGAIYTPAASSRAFVYDATHGIRDLNSLTVPSPGFVLMTATAVNDNGWIVGYGYGGGGMYKSFVLTPVSVPGDLDSDGDVDLDDFGSFSACYNGANNPPAPGCPPGVDADLDDDGDVDLDDFSIFAANYTGSL